MKAPSESVPTAHGKHVTLTEETENGRQIQRSVYGKTRKEVCEKLNTILHNKQMGIYVTPSQTLLKDWLVQWLSSYSSVSVKPATYISYEGYIYQSHYSDSR